jgi:SPOR domain
MINRTILSLLWSDRAALVLVCFLFLGKGPVWSQEIQINEDASISTLCKNWINNNRTNPKVEGWRVQIMANTDREQVEEVLQRFRLAYPDTAADWVYDKPYYKLRAGAFRSRPEAVAFVSSLFDFPGAYPAKDLGIHPKDFLR